MPNPRVVRSARSAGKSAGESSGKKKWIVIAALFLLFAGVGAWAMSSRPDPHVQRVQELRAQMENAPPEQRRELWGQMRQEFEQMPEASREAMFEERRQREEVRESKYMAEFFAKSKKEQIAEIDKRIDESEKRRKEREQRRAQRGNAGSGGGNRAQLAQATGGGPGGGRGPGSGNRDSLQRRKSYLDKSSPDSRAQRGAYRRMYEERRAQRGLPPNNGRRS
jgi:hypothetical protein